MTGPETQPETRVGYVVSRFPSTSETFVVREMDGVEANGVHVEPMSLFPAKEGAVHPASARWMPGLVHPSGRVAASALIRGLVTRPRAMARIVGTVVRETWRSPGSLARSLVTVAVAAALVDDVRDRKLTHPHAHFASYPALAAWVCHRLCGVSYSFTAHAYDIFVSQAMLGTKLAEAEFVATISEFNRDFLDRRRLPGDRTPIEVVHMGVDPTSYEFRPRSAPENGPIRALCVASLQTKKGHAVLFEALASGAGLERVVLDLAGGGELREPLERLAADLGIADRVRFHGALPESQVRDLLDATNMFVLPSIVAPDGQMEGLPVALIEAAACGVPSVASDMSGIPELIEDGVTGFLAAPGDPVALAGRLEAVASGAPLDLAKGRSIVESEFDVRESAVRMTGLFRSVARSR